MRSHFQRHLDTVTTWLSAQKHLRVSYCDYASVLTDPQTAAKAIADFLEAPLEIAKMTAAVDPALYRQRISQ